MAEQIIPQFCNDAGVASISIGAREFECIGARPPHDHPHVFLDMGDAAQIICPYCSTQYKFSPNLKPHMSDPANAQINHQ